MPTLNKVSCMTPARFFLRCGLSFFKGYKVGRQWFLRDEGVVGSVFFLEKHYYPFDFKAYFWPIL